MENNSGIFTAAFVATTDEEFALLQTMLSFIFVKKQKPNSSFLIGN